MGFRKRFDKAIGHVLWSAKAKQMLEIIRGSSSKAEIENLIAGLQHLDLTGTLYVGYPVVETADQTTFIDATLVAEEYGLVLFDIAQEDPNRSDFWERLQDRQDYLYSAIHNKLFASEKLRERRELAIEINVISYLPYSVPQPTEREDLLIASSEELTAVVCGLSGFDQIYLKPLNAVIQRVMVLKPPKKRLNVTKANSRGAILKQIEKETANLDRWQNKAALESPEGPQRIRGLAGSGKTIVLALKAAYLHAQHPDWTIAVTFQTRSLYQQFEDLIRRFTFEHINDEPDWSKLRLLHAWGSAKRPGVYSEIAAACGMTPRAFESARRKYGRYRAFEGACTELLQLAKIQELSPLFDAVLIDEAQDFPQAFFRLAYVATRDPKRIVWAYDELQNLGDFRMSPPDELFGKKRDGSPLVTLRDEESRPQQDIILPVCYRNTPWALATAHALGFGIYRKKSLVQYFDEAELWYKIGYRVKEGKNEAGHEVTLVRREDASPKFFYDLLSPPDAVVCCVFDTPSEQYERVADEITQNLSAQDELEPSDILIILPDAYRSKPESAALIESLRSRGIEAHLAGVTSSQDELFRTDSVAISHIFRAKGNEAPMVYLLNSQYGFEGPELIKRRNILFTAITRSRAWVRIYGHGAAMQDLKAEIDEVIANDYSLKFRVPTSEQLENIRKIHRDRTPDEQAAIRRYEQTLEEYLAAVQAGEISEDVISRDLRDQLVKILGGDNDG